MRNMKKTHLLTVFIFLVIIISQPFITTLFIDDLFWISLIALLGILINLYPIFYLYKQIVRVYRLKLNENNKSSIKAKSELNELYDLTKDDFIYYKHSIGKPFEKISHSVSNILKISPDDFSKNYKRYKAGYLYDGVFERMKKYQAEGMRVPQYEIELRNQKNNFVKFDVVEKPIYNEHQELVGIWGALRHLNSDKLELDLKTDINDDKLNLLLNNVNDGIILIKGDRFVDCNTRTLEIFDASLDQIIMYSPFSNKYSPEVQPSGRNSQEDALRRMALAYEGEPQEFEWVHLRQTGEPFNVKIKLIRYDYQEEVYLLAIIKDITFKYELDNRVQKKSKLIDLLFRNSSIAMLRFNLEKEIEDYNLAFSNLFDTGKEILNKNVQYILHNDDLDQEIDNFTTSNGNPIRTHLFNSKTGENIEVIIKIISFDENELNKGGLILIEEVSELKKIKINLEIQENNFNEIIEKSNDVLYKFDLRANKYVYVSKSVKDIFEYTSEEFKAMSELELKSVLHPKEYSRANVIIAKLFDGKLTREDQQLEYRIINKSGIVKWVRDSYSIVLDENGNLESIIGVINDLTLQKNNEIFIDQKDRLLQSVAENIPQGITIIIEDKIEYVNTNLLEMTAYSKEELNDKEALFVFAPEEEKKRLRDDYIKAVTEGTEGNELSFWFKKKTGEYIYIRNKYYIDSKNIQNRYILSCDITQQRINDYKENPSLSLKKELETYVKNFKTE